MSISEYASFIRRRQILETQCCEDYMVYLKVPALQHCPHQLKTARDHLEIAFLWDPDRRIFVYPNWQFANGSVIPEVVQILKAMGKDRYGGWEGYGWFTAHHMLLGGHSPAQFMQTHPERVWLAFEEEQEVDVSGNF